MAHRNNWQLAHRIGMQLQAGGEQRNQAIQQIFNWLVENPELGNQLRQRGAQAMRQVAEAAHDAIRGMRQGQIPNHLARSEQVLHEVDLQQLDGATDLAAAELDRERPGWNRQGGELQPHDSNQVALPDTHVQGGTSFLYLPWKEQVNHQLNNNEQMKAISSWQQAPAEECQPSARKQISPFLQQSHTDSKKHTQPSFQQQSGSPSPT